MRWPGPVSPWAPLCSKATRPGKPPSVNTKASHLTVQETGVRDHASLPGTEGVRGPPYPYVTDRMESRTGWNR